VPKHLTGNNTRPEPKRHETSEVCKHLGIYLGKTIERTIEETMRNTEAKRIKRRILATTPPPQTFSTEHY
jgi:hypothetical protein